MAKLDFYIDFNFLVSFFNQRPANTDIEDLEDIDNIDKLRLWADFFQLLKLHCNIIVDKNKEDFIEAAQAPDNLGKLLTMLIKKTQIKTNSEIINYPDVFQSIDEDDNFFLNLPNANSFFFLSKPEEECNTIENDFGYICIDSNNIFKKIRFLLNWNRTDLNDKNKILSWEFLQKMKHPCNSIIINDSFVLKESEQIQENLINIIKALLPEQSLKIPFQILIVTDEFPNINARFKKIIEQLNSISEQHQFDQSNVTIVKKKIHNRNILTNYLLINSDYGFNVFKDGKVSKKTPIRSLPITYLNKDDNGYNSLESDGKPNSKTVYDSYLSLLNEYTKSVKSALNNEYLSEFVGSKNNRLLD